MLRERVTIGLKGAAMGMAEVVPGVSGGTIAFVTGIYERLLTAITSVGPDLLGVFKARGVTGVWRAVQGPFLLNLAAGMIGGLVIGVFAITYLLEAYPPVVWAFFFGLIVASAWYIGRMVSPWNLREVAALLVGLGLALAIVMGVPGQGNQALWFVFLSGAVAISALLLPGISGSFILLLLGMYGYIIPTVKGALSGAGAEAWGVLVVFAAGCLTGLLTFSRILSWLFAKYPQPTFALLTGFMLGSLYKLWPWRIVTGYARDPSGEFIVSDEGVRKVLTEAPVLPAVYEATVGTPAYLVAALLATLGGAALILLLGRYDTGSTTAVPGD